MAVARPMPELAPVTTETGASLMAPNSTSAPAGPRSADGLGVSGFLNCSVRRPPFGRLPEQFGNSAPSADDATAQGGDPVVGAAPAGVGVLAGAGGAGAG